MKNIINKIALACQVSVFAFVIALLASPPSGFAAYNDDQATGSTNIRTGNIKITDVGIYDSSGNLRYKPGTPDQFTSGQVSMGSSTAILSTATTSGFSAGHMFTAWLAATSANALEGSVLVSTTAVAGKGVSVIVAPATVGLTNNVGVAVAAASAGSTIQVYSDGWVLALTTGTVVPGDQLATSSLSAGYLYAPSSGTNSLLPSTATIAVALTAGNANGGRIRVRLKD